MDDNGYTGPRAVGEDRMIASGILGASKPYRSVKARLKEAAVDGLVLAVKYAIVIAILLFVATDYMKTRSGAELGANAYRYLEAGVKAGKLPADWTKPAEVPAHMAPTALPVPVVTPVETPVKK